MIENTNKSSEECACKGIGWMREDKEVCDDDFGRLVPCACNHEALDWLKSLEPEPEPLPDLSPAQLRWMEYTE